MTNARTHETIDKFEKVIVKLVEYNYREAKLKAKVRASRPDRNWFRHSERAQQ